MIWIVPVLRTISPHHLLIRFWMSVQVARFFPSWMDFLDIIRHKLNLRTNIRLHLFVLGELLHIEKCLSALKTLELHFSGQWPWSSMISSQLSRYFWMTSLLILVWECITYHLRLVFEICWHYSVRLNPHKCIFCVNSGRLLGFIVSKEGVRVDPLKVEEILQLSPPKNIRHL